MKNLAGMVWLRLGSNGSLDLALDRRLSSRSPLGGWSSLAIELEVVKLRGLSLMGSRVMYDQVCEKFS